MTKSLIQSSQVKLERIRLNIRISELSEEIQETENELQRLKSFPWYNWRASLRKWQLRSFIIEMNAQIRAYQKQLNP